MTESTHKSFWDCFENNTHKRLAFRRVKDWDDSGESTLHITVYECRECGEKFVCETFDRNTDWPDDNWYSLRESTDVSQVLADYGLE